jgi:hypothetical protein
LLTALLVLRSPGPKARADGSLAYKYEDYREADGRIAVRTQSTAAEQDLGFDTRLKLTGTLDAIAGATPTGQPAPAGSDQVGLTQLHERRKAWSGDLSHQFGPVNLDAGFAESRESDYVSRGWSVTALIEANEKNTTFRAGLAGTDDRVEIFFASGYRPKHTQDAILGVTQLIDPLTFVTLNLSGGRANGYLSEQHKQVEKTLQLFPGVFLPEAFAENRPDHRAKGIAYLSLNRALPTLHAAVEGSYRFYHDSYGVTAQTLELGWLQQLGARLILQPTLRYFTQTAANFYHYNLDDTAIMPVRIPNGQGQLYSSDFRLSALDTWSYGLKAIWTVADWLQLDLAYARYDMRGRDGVTPASAYTRAGITTAGVKLLW